MSSTSVTAGNIMDKSASLMNDTAKTVYTYEVQMPYLNMALAELQEHFQLNNISVTNKTAAEITIPIGTTEVGPFDGEGSGVTPTYPQDLVEIQGIYERLSGSVDPYIPLVKREFLPLSLVDLPVESLGIWAWQNQRIKFVGATTEREIKLDYICNLFPEITNQAAVIGVANARSFLQYRTASLCSEFIGENATRAGDLNTYALLALDRVTGIGSKAKQSINTRRRPFMASYKRRSIV